MLFESIPSGCGGRWAFGTAILVYLVAYNETNGPTAVFAVILAAFYGAFSALCKSGVKHLQIPYIRASNKFDFLCLFLAVWMDVLALLAAIGALARTLSTCLDAMTGGLARILILGRNSPANEPWPDVLGVVVVFLVTGMFMLGLENTKAFSVLMILGILGINGILIAMSWLKGNLAEWNKEALVSNGAGSLLTAAALTSFAYPHEMANFQKWRWLVGAGLIFFVYSGISIAAACLSTILHCRLDKQYAAVPIFSLLDGSSLNKLVPAAACLLVLSCSGSLLELFPEMYYTIVRLATSEWKILAKQISYESPESGSPILAIFIAGSLSAMLAFACPLQNLSHILAASHLCSGLLRAFYLLYSPFRPKYIQQTNETSLSYSRLSPAPNKQQQQQGNSRRKSLWSFNAPIQNAMKRSKSKLKNKVNCNNEVEREWLLLGEPSSPRPDTSRREAESGILSDADPVASDMEYVAKVENSDSDTSTDIDAIVDEYRQKVKVTTAGPMEKTIRVPSVSTWRISMFLISIILVGCLFTAVGITWDIVGLYSSGISTTSLFSASMLFIPKYNSSPSTTSPVVCVLTISLGFILLSGCLVQSWPAIIFWFISGLILLIRCDAWCCLCLERPMSQQIIPSVSAKTATIRIPRPPKGLVIPGRIQSRR